MTTRALRWPAVLLALLGCGGTRTASGGADPLATLAPPGALARFAAEPVMVLPVTVAAAMDSGWRTAAGGEVALRARSDSILEARFRDRGLSAWIFAGQVARTARRNPTYLADPATLRPVFAVRAALRAEDRALAEPFASQARALAGATGARYSLVPMEMELRADGPRIQVAIVDVRLARLVWVGSVAGAPRSSYAPSVLTDIMDRAADLVVPR